MALPKCVKIHPQVVTLKSLSGGVDPSLMGQFAEREGTIYLDSDLPPITWGLTLIHEILHAIFTYSGIAYDMGKEEEEKLVRKLEGFIYAFIIDNPKLITYLQEEYKNGRN